MSNGSSSKSTPKRENVICEDLSIGAELFKIRVINNVDNTELDNFNYSTRSRNTTSVEEYVSPKEDPCPCPCTAETGCIPGVCPCEDTSSVIFDAARRIVCEPVGATSYNDKQYLECGKHCNCKGSCNRQLSYDYVMKKVEVRYRKDVGFCVIARQHIAAGMPIANYVGTLMTLEHRHENRNHTIMKEDYVFNVMNEDGLVIDVDAASYGNVSRFINHSCDPNTHILKAYSHVNYPDSTKISIPKIVIVASRYIQPGDELFLDYGTEYFYARNIPCLCYSPVCYVPPPDYDEKAMTLDEALALRDERRKNVKKNFHDTKDVEPPVIDITD